MRIEAKTVIGISRRGFFASSANAPEFSQPTKPDMAIGNASAKPAKPAAPVPPRFWKGAPMWPPARKRMTIESRISPAASTEKKMKAQMVEITTPRRSKGDLSCFQLSRSEEHTSELQSRPHLVCRLL